MTIVRAPDPAATAIAASLRKAVPVVRGDVEARAERRILRRMDIREAVRK